MKQKIVLRKYTKSDYEFIYNVKNIVYEKYVDELFGGWDDSTQHKMLDDFIEAEEENINIILCGNEKIGFINGKILPDGEYEQGNICLLPKWQGKGIGTYLLKEVIERQKDHSIVLRVFKSNPAKNLYERLGFKTYSETQSHFLMRKDKV